MIKDNPCKECVAPKRHIGCHGPCQEYQEWRKQQDALNKELRNKKHQKGIGYLGEHWKSPSKCKGGQD